MNRLHDTRVFADRPNDASLRNRPRDSHSADSVDSPGSTVGADGGEKGNASGYWLRCPEQEDVQDIAAWLGDPQINQWFDFGLGRQTLSELAVRLMLQSERHCMRVFGPHGHARASGLVAVSELTHAFGTGSFWVLRDSHRPACHDMTFLAARTLLAEAFEVTRLHSISAWVVEANTRSQRLLTRLGFQRLGIQRACHVIAGTHVARVLFDMLPDELCEQVTSPEHRE